MMTKMTWWEKALSGFNTPKLSEEERKMGKSCPMMTQWLLDNGYYWHIGYQWWQRVWITHVPIIRIGKFPHSFEEINETFTFDVETEEWTHRIVDPTCLAALAEDGKCYGMHGGNWELYVKNVGTKE